MTWQAAATILKHYLIRCHQRKHCMGVVIMISPLEKRKGGSGSISEQTRQKKKALPGPQFASVGCNFLRELSMVGLIQDRLKSTHKSPEASPKCPKSLSQKAEKTKFLQFQVVTSIDMFTKYAFEGCEGLRLVCFYCLKSSCYI